MRTSTSDNPKVTNMKSSQSHLNLKETDITETNERHPNRRRESCAARTQSTGRGEISNLLHDRTDECMSEAPDSGGKAFLPSQTTNADGNTTAQSVPGIDASLYVRHY